MRSGHLHLLLGHNHLLHTKVTQICISNPNLQILPPPTGMAPKFSPNLLLPLNSAPAKSTCSSRNINVIFNLIVFRSLLVSHHIVNIFQIHWLLSIPIATTNAASISCLNNYNNVLTHHSPTNLYASLIHSQPPSSRGVLQMQNCCIILWAETFQ